MTIHEIQARPETIHGQFARDMAPILYIDSGDTVIFDTIDARWGADSPDDAGNMAHLRGDQDGHALCGPVAIRGAKAGMTLAVHIVDLRLGDWGWSRSGLAFREAYDKRLGMDGNEVLLQWTLDPDALIGRDQHGHQIRLRPFMGLMGMPADEPGMQSTAPPRLTGGNLDCKELVIGSTLYLPIALDEALFSVGDGHAVQGDGEVSGTAIECPMARCELRFELIEDMPIRAPRARTPDAWLSFGVHEDLNEAAFMALDGILDLMMAQYDMDRGMALALASNLVDLRITQIVNGVQGVHAALGHDTLTFT